MIRIITNIILSISLILVFLMLFFSITNKNLITEKNLTSYIEDGDILNVNASYILMTDENITLKNKLSKVALQKGVPDLIVEDIMNSDEINEILATIFSDRIHDSEINIDDDLILNKLNSVALESSESHLNITMSNEELSFYIDQFYNEVLSLLPEHINIIGNVQLLEYWELTIDYDNFVFYICITVIILLFIIINKSLYKPLKFIGISLLACGTIYVLLGSSEVVLNQIIMEQLNGPTDLLSPLITNLLTNWFVLGVVFAFTGIFIIILYNVSYRFRLK